MSPADLEIVCVLAFYYFLKKYPRKNWLRLIHPVVAVNGPLYWAPYNLSYTWPAVPVAWLSMMFFKKRYLPLWSKYNYVISAGFSSAIAISGLVIFFAVQWSNFSIDWWGNNVPYLGCEGAACTLLEIPDVGYFGPGPGEFK